MIAARVQWCACAAFTWLTCSFGCADATPKAPTTVARAKADGHQVFQGGDDPRCEGAGREFSEYDTSGDGIPDVRKVFLRLGDVSSSRLVLICRQADINRDGVKDVVRVYDDEGRPLRESVDRNFDGRVDDITAYQSGEALVHQVDSNFDGRFDTKIFYQNGVPTRAERDLAGRSTPEQWRPDRWEYFERGQLVRMGTDLDGDTRVDRWERDQTWKRAQDAAKSQARPSGDAD